MSGHDGIPAMPEQQRVALDPASQATAQELLRQFGAVRQQLVQKSSVVQEYLEYLKQKLGLAGKEWQLLPDASFFVRMPPREPKSALMPLTAEPAPESKPDGAAE